MYDVLLVSQWKYILYLECHCLIFLLIYCMYIFRIISSLLCIIQLLLQYQINHSYYY